MELNFKITKEKKEFESEKKKIKNNECERIRRKKLKNEKEENE